CDIFFFSSRRRHTRWPRDWSSDVCSSDLLWNPVLVAEEVGTLAALARGRFILQCGLGDDESQFAAMGARLTTRPSAFEESLSIRSEERRVGKECRSRWSPNHEKNKGNLVS